MVMVVLERSKTLSVKIPAGVDTGDRIRLRAKVKQASMAHRQAICTFRFRLNSTRFSSVKATTCIAKSRSTSFMAALGGEMKYRPLMVVKLKVHSETQTGFSVCAVRRGNLSYGGAQGDLLCRVVVETPVGLNESKTAAAELQRKLRWPNRRAQQPALKELL